MEHQFKELLFPPLSNQIDLKGNERFVAFSIGFSGMQIEIMHQILETYRQLKMKSQIEQIIVSFLCFFYLGTSPIIKRDRKLESSFNLNACFYGLTRSLPCSKHETINFFEGYKLRFCSDHTVNNSFIIIF